MFKEYASPDIYVKANMMYALGMPKSQGRFSLDLLFRALADPTRLRLLNLIGDREVCVCYFVEILRTNQPKISRHLAYLRKAGIATARRDGKWMHYRLAIPRDEVAARILRGTLRHLREKPEMQRDTLRLRSACCAPQKYAVLQGAPPPAFVHTGTR
jgi:ArsR family transcriptional regulator, arsenate/arsenite/antimonite-responsive transcriptional repressor